MVLKRLCSDTRRHIFSFLSPRYFTLLKSLYRMTPNEAKDLVACVSTFKIGNVESFYLFRKYTMQYYIQRLSVNCNNNFFLEHPVCFPHLEMLEFYVEHRFIRTSFDWELFFERYQTPSLKDISWSFLDIDFLEMTRILKDRKLNLSIRKLKIIPQNTMFRFLEDDGQYPRTKDLIHLYKSCTNLKELRLDYEDKYVDFYYIDMIQSRHDFQKLLSLQLVNRSHILLDHICKNQELLPQLESLEIMWLFDTDTMSNPNSTFLNQFLFVIRKPSLQNLYFSHISWGTMFQDLICCTSIFSENCVKISTKNVNMIVIDCPNGYMNE